jgi:hypothetical protein
MIDLLKKKYNISFLWINIIKEYKKSNLYNSINDDIWINESGIKPKNFCKKKSIIYFNVPNKYFKNEIEKRYKTTFEKIIFDITKKNIETKYIVNEKFFKLTSNSKNIKTKELYKKNIYTKNSKTKYKWNKLNPNFKNKTEFDCYITNSNKYPIYKNTNEQIINLNSMPIKYGYTDVACFTIFDGNFFTYPRDKRKKAKVEIKIQFYNGEYKIYTLYRGQLLINDEGNGQLNTNHAKILLAITHKWQEQGCKFVDKNGYIAFVDIYIRELTKQLGHQISGTNLKYVYEKTTELSTISNLLCDGEKNFAFSFLSRIDKLKIKSNNNKNKTTLRLTFHPFVAKQLYERKVLLRNPNFYKIKNHNAFKFLLCYDRIIFKGNRIKEEINKIAEKLELSRKRQDNLIRNIKNLIYNLNGYKLSNGYKLKIELQKEKDKKYYMLINTTL